MTNYEVGAHLTPTCPHDIMAGVKISTFRNFNRTIEFLASKYVKMASFKLLNHLDERLWTWDRFDIRMPNDVMHGVKFSKIWNFKTTIGFLAPK